MGDKSHETNHIYDKIAELYAKEFSTPTEYIDEFLALVPKKSKIIDIGCATGIDSAHMATKGHEVIGIDSSNGMIKLAKKTFPNINFKKMDFRDIDFPASSLGGVFASYSLIHIPKREVSKLLEKIYKMLKKDGIFYLGLQSGKSEEVFADEILKPDEKIFLNIYSFEEIKKLLISAGFSIIQKYKGNKISPNEFNYSSLYIISKK